MKTVSVLIFMLIITGCNPFPYKNSHTGGGVWSEDGQSILYYRVSYTQWDFLAIDSPSREDPRFTLMVINPDGSGNLELPVKRNAWPESMYYMKNSGYIVYNYFGGDVGEMAISLYRFNGEHTVLTEDAEPFDSEHIRIIPSRDGQYLARVTPELEGYGNYDIPIINAVVTLLDATSLEVLHTWEHIFQEYYDYIWYTDGNFIIRDFASWNETSDTYTGFSINPSTGVATLIPVPDDYSELPETSSSQVSAEGKTVFVDDSGIHIEDYAY